MTGEEVYIYITMRSAWFYCIMLHLQLEQKKFYIRIEMSSQNNRHSNLLSFSLASQLLVLSYNIYHTR